LKNVTGASFVKKSGAIPTLATQLESFIALFLFAPFADQQF
jgi:hypothetical protein